MSERPLDLSSFIPPGWRGKLPPCLIQVNAQGELSHQGAPLIHPGILELIYQSVHFEDGVYLLRIGQQSCQLEVEDTFWVVRGASRQGQGVVLTLSDGSSEPLDPTSLWIGAGEVLYCRVKAGAMPARFLRQAYYQIAELIEEEGEGFALVLGQERYPLARR
ncbi:MAG: DUF1285 domain-containing protein [Desulfarculus sp.]|nr:DUF1285 domain-containing protein [Desulfarculus sp.]